MPAVSKAQRRLFGACEHGAGYSSCPNMSKEKMREWSTTSEKGLPERKGFKMPSAKRK
jgi:hypothetical protein